MRERGTDGRILCNQPPENLPAYTTDSLRELMAFRQDFDLWQVLQIRRKRES